MARPRRDPLLIGAALLLLVGYVASRCVGAPDVPPRVAGPSPEATSPAVEPTAPVRSPSTPERGRLVPVLRVVDGDTIHVLRGGRDVTIRLIGIDTPEVDWYGGQAECYGARAGRFLMRLLEGERVRLEFDRDRIDPYDRTLAYVYLEDGRMVNELLVRRGYAEVTIFEPNDRYEPDLRAAESRAREGDAGLWSACPS
ncbi:MAG: thermonuclease family protein [Actinomycetota bacterium]